MLDNLDTLLYQVTTSKTQILVIKGIYMSNKLQEIFEQLIPFILLGIAIALVIGLFIMLSYVLLYGIILGAIIWGGVMLKNYLFPANIDEKNEGRIIDHDDKK